MSTLPRSPFSQLSDEEAQVFKLANEMTALFNSPVFKHILAFMEELEKAALLAIEENQSDMAAWPLQQRWRAAKQQRRLLLRYIESIREKKLALLEEVLRESGIPPNTATVIGAMLDVNHVPINRVSELAPKRQ